MKKLSEIPFADLKVGDRVISALDNPGQISMLTPEGVHDEYCITARYDSVELQWDYGAKSYVFHSDGDFIVYLG